MSEELQRYLKRSQDNIYYQGDNLDGYEHYIIGSTTLNQLLQAKIINGFVNDIVFKPFSVTFFL